MCHSRLPPCAPHPKPATNYSSSHSQQRPGRLRLRSHRQYGTLMDRHPEAHLSGRPRPPPPTFLLPSPPRVPQDPPPATTYPHRAVDPGPVPSVQSCLNDAPSPSIPRSSTLSEPLPTPPAPSPSRRPTPGRSPGDPGPAPPLNTLQTRSNHITPGPRPPYETPAITTRGPTHPSTSSLTR